MDNNANNRDDGSESSGSSESTVDFLANLPPEVMKNVEKLRDLDVKRDAIMKEYLKERAALEAKFSAKISPLFDERFKIVTGEEEEEEEAEVPQDNNGTNGEEVQKTVGVPAFWAAAIGQMEEVGEHVTESDIEALEYIRDIQCIDRADGMGFKIIFYFAENPFFTNETLTKDYHVPNLLLADEPIIQDVTGTDIDWKQGKNLCERTVQKKQRAKGGRKPGQIRIVTKTEETESFFRWFNPPKLPGPEDLEEMTEEQADAIEESFDGDYDIAQALRLHIIPKAVRWFTGEALEDEDFMPGSEFAFQLPAVEEE